MKIQSLAIIFILIVLPITIILTEYSHAQFDTRMLETKYDETLITATYDALKAFQINTFNDPYSDIADRKISSIEAATSAFYNSIKSSLGMQGYSIEDIQLHTPALVYTMYDGYYIYSPYNDIIPEGNPVTSDYVKDNLGSDDIKFGFKPYVYYSCRYTPDSDSDFVITYSLDNYISIVGMIDGVYVNKSGYLISPTKLTKHLTEEIYYYDGVEIKTEGALSEYLMDADGTTKLYKYIKINGTKYYLDEANGKVFYITGTKRINQVTSTNALVYDKYVDAIKNNTQGITYYKDAYEFTKWVIENSVLEDLRASDAVDKDGIPINWSTEDYEIFADDIPLEYPNSNFNEQRKAVIRNSIESNLSVAIANFNGFANTINNDFQMPKLKETDWELIENQVSIVSFLQGFSIGGKIYNGYTVVNNDKTEEVVKEENIYITTSSDNYYHKVNDTHFLGSINNADIGLGVLNTDFHARKDVTTQRYYYPKNQLGCYTSIVNQSNVNNENDSIYEYLEQLDDNQYENLKQTYYTALGRERWGTYKVSTTMTKTIDDLVTREIPAPVPPVTPDPEPPVTPDPVPPVIPEPEPEPDPEPVIPTTHTTLKIIDVDGVTENPDKYVIPLAETQIIMRKKIEAKNERGIAYVKYIINRTSEFPADSANWEYIENNSTITYKVNQADVGTYYLHVEAKDNNNNRVFTTRSYTVEKEQDEIYPRVTINNIDGVENIYTMSLAQTQVTIKKQIVASDESGIANINYIVTKSSSMPANNAGWSPIANNDTISYTVNSSDVGTYYIYVKATDKNGNTTTGSKFYVVNKEQDIIPPTVEIIDTDGITGTYIMEATQTKITMKKQITAIDAGGISNIKYIVTKSSSTPADNAVWTEITNNPTIEYTVNQSNLGTYYLHIKATDNSGNERILTKSYVVRQNVNISIQDTDGRTSYKITFNLWGDADEFEKKITVQGEYSQIQ